MKLKKLEPNVKLCTQWITVCGREGRPDEAAQHLSAMEKAGLKPDLPVCDAQAVPFELLAYAHAAV